MATEDFTGISLRHDLPHVGRALQECRKTGDKRKFRDVCAAVQESVRKQGVNDRWSVRQLFEETVPDGREVLAEMDHYAKHGNGHERVFESGPINTAAFSNIIGSIALGQAQQQLDLPDFIGPQLFEERTAATKEHEVIPGISMLGDQAEAVGEGEPYPKVGTGEFWVTRPRCIKRGFIAEATEEAIREDKTGQLTQQITSGAESMGITVEKDRLRTALGVDTTFRWKDNAAQATYANSHTGFALDNLIASNAMVDYTDFAAVDASFDSVVDPSTGEIVNISGAMQVVFPKSLKVTAARILNSTEVRQGAIDASTPVTISGNPLNDPMFNSYSPLTNQYVKEVTGSDTTWFAGMFSRAFADYVYIPTEFTTENRGTSDAMFERDIALRVKVRRSSAPTVIAPWFVAKCTD